MFKLKRRWKSLLCGALSAVLFCWGSLGASAQTLNELRQRQEELATQKEKNDELLETLREDAEQKKAYRDTLYEQISTVQTELDVLRQKITQLDLDIADGEDRIAEKQGEIDSSMDLLKARIRALYITGNASALEIIFDSTDLFDLAEKIQILKAVTAHDQELIDTLNGQLADVKEETERVSRDREELGKEKKELDLKSAELTTLYEEASRLYDEAEDAQWSAQAGSEILDGQIAENEEAIAALEEEIRKQQAETAGASTSNLGGEGYVGTGRFLWPLPGYTTLTCYFGEGGHRGVDISGGAVYGKAIIASDGGTVTYAGWNDSYGNCVFIDHGNGYQTRYAHMSLLNTQTGAAVEQGQVIGYVGNTGYSFGAHLHFEVIYCGSLMDPMGYF